MSLWIDCSRVPSLALVLLMASQSVQADAGTADPVLQVYAERQQVERVQVYYNRLQRLPDNRVWGRADYWATPTELMRAGGGDCEDLAAAKYFALRELGVPVERLRLVYARIYETSRKRIEPHMVLWYRESATADWLILDNLQDPLEKLAQRGDLQPLLTFNEDHVARWTRMNGEQVIGDATLLHAWEALLARQKATDTVALVLSIHTL